MQRKYCMYALAVWHLVHLCLTAMMQYLLRVFCRQVVLSAVKPEIHEGLWFPPFWPNPSRYPMHWSCPSCWRQTVIRHLTPKTGQQCRPLTLFCISLFVCRCLPLRAQVKLQGPKFNEECLLQRNCFGCMSQHAFVVRSINHHNSVKSIFSHGLPAKES